MGIESGPSPEKPDKKKEAPNDKLEEELPPEGIPDEELYPEKIELTPEKEEELRKTLESVRRKNKDE